MWTLYACLMEMFRVGHVDPLCMINGKYSLLAVWTLHTCLMENIQSWSCGFPIINENTQSWSFGPSMINENIQFRVVLSIFL